MNCSDWKKEYLTNRILDTFTKVIGETNIREELTNRR